MMRLFLPRSLITFVLLATSSFCPAQEATIAPNGRFRVVQTREGDGVRQTLTFRTDAAHPITLEAIDISWFAECCISPDGHWLLRVQKTASGQNEAYLYRVEAAQRRLWRLEPSFSTAAFAYVERITGIKPEDLYHTGIEFEAWDPRRNLLRFRIRGTGSRSPDRGVSERLNYRLSTNTFSRLH